MRRSLPTGFPDAEVWDLCERIALPLRQGGGLNIRGRPVPGGAMLGLDFDGFEEYVPGKDLRHLDWGLYARTRRYYLRKFADEGSGVLTVLLDASGSMAIGEPSKWEFARRLGAVVVFAALKELHQVQLGVINDGVTHWLPPRAGLEFAPGALEFIGGFHPGGETKLDESLERLMLKERPGTALVVSDFLDPSGPGLPIVRLRRQGFTVDLCRVSSLGEFDLPRGGGVADAEGPGVARLPDTGEARQLLIDRIRAHREEVVTAARKSGAGFVECSSEMPLSTALDRLLASWSTAVTGLHR